MLGDDEVLSLATNHPKPGDVASFNQALCGLWAAGLGPARAPVDASRRAAPGATAAPRRPAPRRGPAPHGSGATRRRAAATSSARLFDEFLERGRELMRRRARPRASAPATEPVVITGAALGLPGAEQLFDDANVARLLDGEQGIDVIPARLRREMLDKHITRLVKGDDGGARSRRSTAPPTSSSSPPRAGAFDLGEEFGVDAERLPALGRDTQLAIAAGIDALRDAGIPLVQHYKTTTRARSCPTGGRCPTRCATTPA